MEVQDALKVQHSLLHWRKWCITSYKMTARVILSSTLLMLLVMGFINHSCGPWSITTKLPPPHLVSSPSTSYSAQLGHRGSVEVDPRHTFYVLNPRGDLPNTEKMFAKWFASQRGWRGVVGRAPTTQEYTTALEEHELFV